MKSENPSPPIMAPDDLARMIDHTLLTPEATRHDIERLCHEAAEYRFAAVCVNPVWVPLCREILESARVAVCTVVGFPLGASASETKAYEARHAAEQGASELDMVAQIGALRSGDHALVERDIRAVVDAVGSRAIVKVILETCLLAPEQIVTGAKIAKSAGARFVKTSSGFSHRGATVEDVRLLRAAVGPELGVKASGGIRTAGDATRMIAAGATRIGTSHGVRIVREAGAASGHLEQENR